MDLNTLAKSIVEQAIGEKPTKRPTMKASKRGIARAESLTPERRKDIAIKAASVRWSTNKPAQ